MFFYQSSSINTYTIFNTYKIEQVWNFSAKWGGTTTVRTDIGQTNPHHGISSKSVADINKDKPGHPPDTGFVPETLLFQKGWINENNFLIQP